MKGIINLQRGKRVSGLDEREASWKEEKIALRWTWSLMDRKEAVALEGYGVCPLR